MRIPLLLTWVFMVTLSMTVSVAQANSEPNLGKVMDVTVTELPYFDQKGTLLGVIKPVNKNDFVGQDVLETAPRGLIGLRYQTKVTYFRSVNFAISAGKKVVCPEVLQSESSTTKKPVVSSMGREDCETKGS